MGQLKVVSLKQLVANLGMAFMQGLLLALPSNLLANGQAIPQ